jgi:hypothetical protein
MNEWTDAQLDEDIKLLRNNGEFQLGHDGTFIMWHYTSADKVNHYYKDLLKIVVKREMRRTGLELITDGMNTYANKELADRMYTPGYRQNYMDRPFGSDRDRRWELMLDYEDALVARYVSHYTKDGEPTGVLSDFYRDTEGLEIPANLLKHHRTAKFDAHFRETAGYGEQQWEDMLGFHPVDLDKYPVKLLHPDGLDVLQNQTLRAWTLKQTEGIVQKRLEKEHDDMVQGALDFVHILNRSLKSTTFFKWRNDRMKPRTYVTEPEEITRLDAALNKIQRNSR